MTLALLLTAVTGAWADEAKVYTEAVVFNSLKAGDVLTDGFSITKNIGDYIKVKGYKKDSGTAETEEYSDLLNDCTYPGGIVITVSGYGISGNYTPYADGKDANAWIVSKKEVNGSYTALYLDGYNYLPAGSPLTVEWDPATKTGNFVMPAFDVEIAPIYAPVAQWAKVENADQLPTAIEGIYAESTDAIVKAGTVAKIGETENPQGTVMYAVTSTNQATAPALDAFSADVPTAKDITAAGDVYVWYYIKGADAPEGDKATAENTFNDSEICTEPITVTVLSNKFDIQFKAANDNTIETGKATVKVGDEAAEVKEGKLTGVKMNSKVTVTAKDGYKFRKVEVKKKAAAPAYTLLDNTMTAWTAGKYAVPAGGLTYSAAITVSGDVTLVLTDGETLTLNKGISLAEGATLTVEGNGTMNINGTNNSTASTVAGTGMLVLTSGTLNAKGGNGDGLIIYDYWLDIENNIGVSGGVAINGNVTVNGGTVTATGGNGGDLDTSEIVGGSNNHGGNGGAAISGTVTVNAGGWTATNGSNGNYTGGKDPSCSAGTGGKAVAGTVTDNR